MFKGLNAVLNSESKHKNLLCFLSTFIIGVLAHGFMFFNKISFFDDIAGLSKLNAGSAIAQGRLFWAFLIFINDILFGNYSSPLFCGLISTLLIAMTNVVIIRILDIKTNFEIILSSSIITLSTGTIVLYAYMYAAIVYSLSIFLSVLSTYYYIYFCEKPSSKYSIVVLLIVLSMGITQNNFLFGFIIYLYYSLILLFENKFNLKNFLIYFFITIFSITLYCLIVKFSFPLINSISKMLGFKVNDIHITSYQGLNRIENFSYVSLKGIIGIFKNIFRMDYIVFEKNLYAIYILIISIIVLVIIAVILNPKRNLLNKVFIVLCMIGIVLSINCVYMLQEFTYIYALTLHQKCLIFMLPIVICCNYSFKPVFKVILYAIVVYYSLYSITFANNMYTSRYIKLQNEIRWDNTLITRIQSTEGYDDEYDIFCYGSRKEDALYSNDGMLWKNLYPYSGDMRNEYSWLVFLTKWCGVDVNKIHVNSDKEDLNLVNSMPCYPDDGSIVVNDNKVYVKFSIIN